MYILLEGLVICSYEYCFVCVCVYIYIYIYIYIYTHPHTPFLYISSNSWSSHTKNSNVTWYLLSEYSAYKVCGAFNKFPDFFVQAFKIVVDSWKFSMLLLYILWDDWPIFMISGSNEQLQQQLEYTLLKPDCHSCWISKMQSGCEDTLEEQYAIKFCFKLGEKMPEKRMECSRLLLEHLAWIKHQFLSGIRDSRKAGSLWDDEKCGRSKEVNRPELIGQRLRFTMLRL